VIYFLIEQNDYTLVKIGYTNNLGARLITLQTGNPRPLTLIAVLDGDTLLESFIHDRYKNYKYNNEWFYLTEDLLQFLKPYLFSYRKPQQLFKVDITKGNSTPKFNSRLQILKDNYSKSDRDIAKLIHLEEPNQQLHNLIKWVSRKRNK
jgi:hypothetical protein